MNNATQCKYNSMDMAAYLPLSLDFLHSIVLFLPSVNENSGALCPAVLYYTKHEGGAAVNRKSVSAVTAAFLVLEVVLYTFFLTFDLTGRGEYTIWLKYSGILLCLLYALLCALRGGDRLVFPAMLFTTGADWFLLVRNDHLELGLVLFLVVQTIYLIRLRRMGSSSGYWLRCTLALLLGVMVFACNLASVLILLVALYFSQLLSNAILAWSARKWVFAVGLTLFVCCDICVGLFNLGILYSFASVGMWLFYLPSQVLIVLSAKEAPHEAK